MKYLFLIIFAASVSFAQEDCFLQHPAGNSMVGKDTGSLTPDRKRVTQFEMFQEGWVIGISVFVIPGQDNQAIRGMIYSDVNGWPVKLLATSLESIIPAQGSKGWVPMKLMEPIKLMPGKFWLGVLSGPSLSPAQMTFTCGGERVISYNPYSLGPSPEFGRIDTRLTGAMNVYVTYEHNPPSVCPPNEGCVVAKWTEVAQQNPQIIGYRLYWGQVSQQYTNFKEVDWGTTTTQVNGLTPNTTYCFAVRSLNAEGSESAFSNEICVNTNTSEGVPVNFQ